MHIPFLSNAKNSSNKTSKSVAEIVVEELDKENLREKIVNFRWVFWLAPSRSPITLSSADLASPSLQAFISRVGCFMELSHSVHNLPLIFAYIDVLTQPHFPLEQYTDLRGSSLVSIINGDVAKARAYIAHDPGQKQIFVSFSGTANLEQGLRDLDSRKVPFCPTAWPDALDSEVSSGERKVQPRWLKHHPPCPKVHRGFSRVYSGLRCQTLSDLLNTLKDAKYAASEIIVTGHSLGAALASLFVADILSILNNDTESELRDAFSHTKLKLVAFGSPRVGDREFMRMYDEAVSTFRKIRGDDAYTEISVKGHKDGVVALPAQFLGFRHHFRSILYSYHGQLYHAQPSEAECSVFRVSKDGTATNTKSSQPHFSRLSHSSDAVNQNSAVSDHHDTEAWPTKVDGTPYRPIEDSDSHQAVTATAPRLYTCGGHKYYNNRCFEAVVGRMHRLEVVKGPSTLADGWEETYLRKYGPPMEERDGFGTQLM